MVTEQKISLLYAEDDPHASVLLEKLLRHKFPELTIYVAADGEQGLALFNEHHPQLILTDIAMPKLDGIEMVKRIRAINPDVFVIAITAYNDAQFRERSKDLRLNHCLAKPVDFKFVLESIGDGIEYLRQRGDAGH